MSVEGAVAVDRVDHGDDALERIAHRQVGMIEHRVQDRRRIGKAGRLDDDPAKRRDAPVVAPAQQILEGGDEIAAHGAAKTTGREQDHVVVDSLDEQMIEPDLAELVDDDDAYPAGPGPERRRFSESGFSGAEKARQDRQRNGRDGAGGWSDIGRQSVGTSGAAGLPLQHRYWQRWPREQGLPPTICTGSELSPRTKMEATAETTGSMQ